MIPFHPRRLFTRVGLPLSRLGLGPKLALALGLVLGLVLAATPVLASADEVNLYSARKEALIKPLLDQFTEQTGIEVNLVTGKADALLQRLKSEGRNSPADLLITVDAGNLHRAKADGLTQAFSSEVVEPSRAGQLPRSGWSLDRALTARAADHVRQGRGRPGRAIHL